MNEQGFLEFATRTQDRLTPVIGQSIDQRDRLQAKHSRSVRGDRRPPRDSREPAARPAPADAEILAIVRAWASGFRNAIDHHRALKEKAGLFIDFAHFRRLCIGDLEDAFGEDQDDRAGSATSASTRMTKNRRRCWLAAFRYFARHAGIEQGVRIIALDRKGHYDCHLVGKAPTDEWQKLVRLAEGFGIDEAALQKCLPKASARADTPASRSRKGQRITITGAGTARAREEA